MKRAGERYTSATYEEAAENISEKVRRIVEEHGPDSVAFYDGNPAGMNAYAMTMAVALEQGLGTRNRYYVGSIDQNPYQLVVETMYGSPIAALMPDVDHARCMLLIGTNPAVSGMNWFGNVPNGWKRILKAQKDGACLIVVDPAPDPHGTKGRHPCGTQAGQ